MINNNHSSLVELRTAVDKAGVVGLTMRDLLEAHGEHRRLGVRIREEIRAWLAGEGLAVVPGLRRYGEDPVAVCRLGGPLFGIAEALENPTPVNVDRLRKVEASDGCGGSEEMIEQIRALIIVKDATRR